MPAVNKICRLFSSVCLALAVSALALLICAGLYERFHLQDALGLDDDVCWLALIVGPLLMIFFHRRLHASGWLAPTIFVASCLGLVAAIIAYLSMEQAADAHQPTGPFSGIGYLFAMALSFYLGVTCTLGMLAGLLGTVGQRMEKLGGAVGQADDEQATR